MKPLILLLFFTLTAGAQEPWKYYQKHVDTVTAITVSDLEGYFAECDSVDYQDEYALLKMEIVGIISAYKRAKRSDTWLEVPIEELQRLADFEKKRPKPTLKGFLEYLKRRRK